MKVLIAIPAYTRSIDIEMAKILLYLERSQKYDLDYIFPVSSHLCRNRNLACQTALDTKSDFLLFLDADIGVNDPTFLDKMIETGFKLDAKVICGAYRIKEQDLNATRYALGMETGRGIPEQPIYTNFHAIKNPQLIDAGGTGIMLIHREVLLKLQEPWFTILDGIKLYVFPEDWYFCKKAREAGFKVAVDPRFSTRHLGYYAWEHNP